MFGIPTSPENGGRAARLETFALTLGYFATRVLSVLGLKTGSGTSTAPAWGWSANAFDGFYWLTPGTIIYTAQATPSVALKGGIVIQIAGTVAWAPNGNLAGSIQGNLLDIGIGRGGDGILQVSRGDLGANATIKIGDPGYARPAAAAGLRGLIWHEFKGAGVADTVAICVKNAADAYVWQTLI